MALTQVRAKFGNTWTVLTYNAATGRYEGTITPTATSAHQTGGYYSLEVEATNATGQTTTLTGAQYKGLRLVVRETAAPTLTLVSPPAGYLTTGSPTFVFSAQDEAGGSGVAPSMANATIDGAVVPCTVTQSGAAYNITIAGNGLSDGPHVVSVRISDYDGNETTVSAAYTVDTVPTVLTVTAPDLHRVVDWTQVEVAGYARDTTAGVASVTVAGKAVTLDSYGRFSTVVPLQVGVNEIQVKATDHAGLSTTKTVWMCRMITDRTEEDRRRVRELTALWVTRENGTIQWTGTTAELAAYMAGLKGAYTAADWARVAGAMTYLAQRLQGYGYAVTLLPLPTYDGAAIPPEAPTEDYLANVEEIRKQLPVQAPDVPADMDRFMFEEANAIEENLVETDRFFPLMERSVIYSGEGFAGEF